MTVRVKIENLSETHHKITVGSRTSLVTLGPQESVEVFVWGDEEIIVREVFEKETG